MTFESKTVVITGAAGNLGCAVADAFASLGARLVLVDATRELLDRAHTGSQTGPLKIAVDLLDARAVAEAPTCRIKSIQHEAIASRIWTPPARPEHPKRPDSGRSDTGHSSPSVQSWTLC